MTANSATIAVRKPTARARTTNGKRLVEGVDGRSRAGRRMHDVIAALTADMGDLSAGEQLQVRAVAALTVRAELLTADLINGKPVDSEELTRVSNSAARLLGALKQGRRKTTAAPPLTLRERLQAEAAA